MSKAVESIRDAVRALYTLRLYGLQLVALCGTVCLIASVATAQQYSVRHFAPDTSRVANDWWSPERTTFTVLAVNDQLRLSQLVKLTSPRPFASSTTEPKN